MPVTETHKTLTIQSKTAHVVSNGCPENRLDVARAENYLKENGFTIVDNMEKAELILFNACGRDSKTESHSIAIIKDIKDKIREDQHLVVWGCLPKIDLAGLSKEYQGIVSPGSELVELRQMLELKQPIDSYFANHQGPACPVTKHSGSSYLRYEGSKATVFLKKAVLSWDNYLNRRFNLAPSEDPTIFYIKISTGCRNACAYCAIRLSRGLTKSKQKEDVLKEFKLGLKKNYKKFSLMGTDLGSYGSDFGINLVDLLQEMTAVEGDYKIYIRNCHPRDANKMLEGLCEVLKTGKIRYIELAAESGSNKILEKMNRKYTIEEFNKVVNSMRTAYPPLIIRTQLISGYPTETEEDFQASVRLLDDTVFDYVEVYDFSARPGTVAEKLEPKVPDTIKKERFIRLYRKAVLNRTSRKLKNIILNRM
jgi:threonylcarbamoyladenosine tRNA methylthiotransferase CDKAL1